MPFLLDTATVSEYRRPRPDPGLLTWAAENAREEMHLASPTLGELIQGVHRLAPSREREQLQRWVAQIEKQFSAHILPFDTEAARVWGEANGAARRHGRRLPPIDSQLAASAIVHDLTIVTRNVRDFKVPEFKGLRVVNPWT